MQLILGKLHIQVSWFKQSARDRVYKLYTRRRKNGYCTQCGRKVDDINKYTNLTYRKCKKYRNRENKLARKRRANQNK